MFFGLFHKISELKNVNTEMDETLLSFYTNGLLSKTFQSIRLLINKLTET